MSWACLWLPHLAMDAVLREREPPQQPFALVHGDGRQTRLLAVDAQALAAGLQPSQSLAEAQALCRDLVAIRYHARQTRAALDLVSAWAYHHSSVVLPDPPHAVVLEVGHSLRLFGSWPRLEQRLRNGMAELGFRHRLALAPNPRAARVLAHHHDGVEVHDMAGLVKALAPLPVGQAGLPPAAATLLADTGFTTLGKVLPLPRAALQRRCGKEAVEAIDLLLGRRPATLQAYRPPERFERHIDFGREVKHVHGLLFSVKRVLGDMALFLQARDAGVQRVTLRLLHDNQQATDVVIALLSPERDPAVLLDVTRLKLENMTLAAPVLEMTLRTDALTAFVPEGAGLFDRHVAGSVPWPQLIERLRARLGQDAVHHLLADPDPRPERASRHHAGEAGRVPAMSDSPLPARPTWLLARPLPLRQDIERIISGPERLETGWWDGGDIRRDYYAVELVGGQRAWVFCAPGERGPFMLHGWFA